MENIFAELAALDDQFGGSTKLHLASRKKQSDTLTIARSKTVQTIDENIEVLKGKRSAANSLYSSIGNGRSQVGAKYSNTWLKDWIQIPGNVVTYLQVKDEYLLPTLEKLKEAVLGGMADDELEEIMARNLALRSKGGR